MGIFVKSLFIDLSDSDMTVPIVNIQHVCII